jgi:carbamoyltransferase
MSNILGISAGYHDAGVSVINTEGDILFASHSERFSGTKHDKNLCNGILNEALTYGDISTVAYYENMWLKKLRQLRSGEPMDWKTWTLKQQLKNHMPYHTAIVDQAKLKSYKHHLSHAAAGFQTSPYSESTVVVIDAIGEFQTASVWEAKYDKHGKAHYKLLWSLKYPDSIGLFYSAYTKLVGLRPMDEEYILMGMAAYGNPHATYGSMYADNVQSLSSLTFKENLHAGTDKQYNGTDFDIAAGAQSLVEDMISMVIKKARTKCKSDNLVYMGGVALNCSANRLLGMYYDNIWIMPNPGDAGSSLGAAALAYGKQLNWKNAFLGYNIEGEYPVQRIINELETNKIVGVASGRAEFGPRALGNRSLLADPRGPEIKDKVNEIKRRQKFRPFAPVILEEFAKDYFIMPDGFEKSPYMQATAVCKRPEDFPAIVHADGTSRVQTVPRDSSGIRELLERWYHNTKCPMLLNTSLNIRGEPMVNDISDAKRFKDKYGIVVCS